MRPVCCIRQLTDHHSVHRTFMIDRDTRHCAMPLLQPHHHLNLVQQKPAFRNEAHALSLNPSDFVPRATSCALALLQLASSDSTSPSAWTTPNTNERVQEIDPVPVSAKGLSDQRAKRLNTRATRHGKTMHFTNDRLQ